MRRNLCGPICIQEVLKRAGVDAGVDELARLAGTDTEGTSLEGLARAAQTKGLKAQSLRIDTLEELKFILDELELPVIAHVFDSHYVLVESIGEDTVLLSDPNFHRVESSRSRFEAIWNGVALAFYRAEGHPPARTGIGG